MGFLKKMFIKINLSRNFYKSFLSFIIIIGVVLLILGSVVYISFINTLQLETENSNISELTQIVNNMDMRFKEMDRIAVNISSNTEFDYFNSAGNKYNMVKELEKYKSGNEFLYDIIYYSSFENEADSRIIFSDGEMNTDLFFRYIYKYDNWSKNEFLTLIKDINMRKVRPMEPVWLNNQVRTNIITSIYPLPINATKPSKVVMFIIEQNVLDKLIKNVLRNYTGCVYVLDENSSLIVSVFEDSNVKRKSDLLENINVQSLQQKVNDKKINGINYSIVKVSSEYNKWTYITVIPTDQFMSKVYSRKNLFNYSLFIVIIIATVIAFALAMQNYKPLRKLIEKLSAKNTHPSEHKYIDDIEYIADIIDQIREKNRHLLKDHFLKNLLYGRYESSDEIKTAAGETNVHFNMSNFMVCVLFIDGCGLFACKNAEPQQTLIRFNMIDILEEMSNEIEGLKGFAVEINDNSSIALILNFEKSEKIENSLTELFYSINETYKQYYRITIGVGSIYYGLASIKESYNEAKKAVYYRLLKGQDTVIFYNEIKDIQKSKYHYPINLEAALIKAIKLPDADEVKRVTLELKEYIFTQKIPPESIQCICYGIINSVIKIIDDMNLDASDCFIDKDDYLSIQTFDTVDSMIDRLAVFCSKICEYKAELKEHKNQQLKSKISDIINKRLDDNTLSLESLAAECNKSPSYISRYFKQQTGESLMQYVDHIRMLESKHLLKTTDLKLKEVLNKVGYIDEANFIRKFKKLEGVTPMQYRKLTQS